MGGPTMKDISGSRFGRLTVIRFAERRGSHYLWWCRCDCGTEKKIHAQGFKSGVVKSCGCFIKELTRQRQITHGASKTPEYRSWLAMMQRCTNPKQHDYKNYGAKGVAVCERWSRFENFLQDMGKRPSGMTLDRIDPRGIYEPTNCRWLDRSLNCAMKRNTKLVFHDGQFKTIPKLAAEHGIKRTTLYQRIEKYGWTLERALTGAVR